MIGADGFTSPPKEGVLRIFTALKNPLSRPGLNWRTLGPMAGTLTITPPRRLVIVKLAYRIKHVSIIVENMILDRQAY
jgi:hypothetical protein